MTKRKIINDPVYDGFLSVDDPVIMQVIEHPWFQRQRRIKQLGLTYLVYPGAMHTRFSHMLGALNLMGRALEVLRQKGVEISDDECRGAKLAILLHDIGHGPFSHTSERVLVDVAHEEITLLMMQRINEEMHGALDTAIKIFSNTYHKHFLHQLVSSQLDMDRLDYLGRDSFFTGVSEGIVGTDRIISMLNVHHERDCNGANVHHERDCNGANVSSDELVNVHHERDCNGANVSSDELMVDPSDELVVDSSDELVVDEKGIYSVEKFIISRRLMYWQVYMHKTVIAADQLLLNILKRVRELTDNGLTHIANAAVSPLDLFLTHHFTAEDFRNPSLLDSFAAVDDDDVMVAVKCWQHSTDETLRTLCHDLVNRRLPAIRIATTPFTDVANDYFHGTGELHNRSYDFNDQEIKVLYKDGRCVDISQASDQLDRHFLEKQVTKYFHYYPKGE